MPPADLVDRVGGCVETLKPGTLLYRFFNNKYEPTYFNTSNDGRWNAPSAEYGVLYVGEHRNGAFAETFLRSPGHNLIATDTLSAKGECDYEVTSALKYVKFHGAALARLGATSEVCHRGLPYDVPQAWSKAIWLSDPTIDGISYFSRHDDEQICFALFDRAAHKISLCNQNIALGVSDIDELLEEYAVGIAPHC